MKNNGFSLVEIVVAVTIIGILTTVGLTVFSGVQGKAKDTKRKEDIDAIAKAFEANYNFGTGKYPGQVFDTNFSSGKKPVSPEGTSYIYVMGDNDKSFLVCAKLENYSVSSGNCSTSNTGCYCRKSTHGTISETATAANLIIPPPPPPPAPCPNFKNNGVVMKTGESQLCKYQARSLCAAYDGVGNCTRYEYSTTGSARTTLSTASSPFQIDIKCSDIPAVLDCGVSLSACNYIPSASLVSPPPPLGIVQINYSLPNQTVIEGKIAFLSNNTCSSTRWANVTIK